MNWQPLTTLAQLEEIDRLSQDKPVLIFKHSTRCGVSMRMLSTVEKAWKQEDDALFSVWFLDLLDHRDISAAIASRYGIEHESPQTLLIKNGTCILDASHHFIDLEEVRTKAA
jgi:bacillithiol system protein YtxJ